MTPYLTDEGVRRDVTTFAQGWDPDELVDAARWLETFDKPVLLCWAPSDPFFKLAAREAAAGDLPGRDPGRVPRRAHVRVPRPAGAAGRGDRALAGLASRTVTQQPTRARFPDFAPRSGGYESFYVKAAAPDRSRAVWIRYTIHQRAHESPRGSMWFTWFDSGADGPRASKVTVATPPEVAADDVLHIGEGVFGPGLLRGRRRRTASTSRGSSATKVPPNPCGTCPARGCTPHRCRRPSCSHPSQGRASAGRCASATGTSSSRLAGHGRSQLGDPARRAMDLAARGALRRPGSNTWLDVALGRTQGGPLHDAVDRERCPLPRRSAPPDRRHREGPRHQGGRDAGGLRVHPARDRCHRQGRCRRGARTSWAGCTPTRTARSTTR